MELTRGNLSLVARIARGNQSLREFAKDIGSNAPTLQRIEQGEVPSPRNVRPDMFEGRHACQLGIVRQR